MLGNFGGMMLRIEPKAFHITRQVSALPLSCTPSWYNHSNSGILFIWLTFFFFNGTGDETQGLCMLGKQFTTELYLQTWLFFLTWDFTILPRLALQRSLCLSLPSHCDYRHHHAWLLWLAFNMKLSFCYMCWNSYCFRVLKHSILSNGNERENP